MRAIPIGRKILLGSALMVVVLVVVLAVFWNRDRGLSRAEYQNNVAILEAADGRRFLGYFVTADKLVCINTYCANDPYNWESGIACANPSTLDTIRVLYPEVAITETIFPTNMNNVHEFYVFKTTIYKGYVNREESAPTREQTKVLSPEYSRTERIVQSELVLYDVANARPRVITIVPLFLDLESCGDIPMLVASRKDENGNDTSFYPRPCSSVAQTYSGRDPAIEDRLLSNKLPGVVFSPGHKCIGFPAYWYRNQGSSQDGVSALIMENNPLMAEYEKVFDRAYPRQ